MTRDKKSCVSLWPRVPDSTVLVQNMPFTFETNLLSKAAVTAELEYRTPNGLQKIHFPPTVSCCQEIVTQRPLRRKPLAYSEASILFLETFHGI